MIPEVLAWLVIGVAVPLNWFVAWRLWRLASLEPKLRGSLRERAALAAHLALVISVFGVVFLNNGMQTPILDLFWTMVITRLAILSLVIPPLRWLVLYRK